jgi:septum formation protein
MKTNMRIILASKSPRRIEMLKNLGLSPEIIPADVDENIEEFKSCPESAVITLAKRKATAISDNLKDDGALIIAADTLVYKENTLLGKPKDEKEAFSMLNSLSGDFHSVYTGFSVSYGDKIVAKAVETKVFFKKLSEKEISDYIASGEPMDKAGAYGIQGNGALFVSKIEGDYFNVVGLPLCELFETIKEAFGFDIENMKN